MSSLGSAVAIAMMVGGGGIMAIAIMAIESKSSFLTSAIICQKVFLFKQHPIPPLLKPYSSKSTALQDNTYKICAQRASASGTNTKVEQNGDRALTSLDTLYSRWRSVRRFPGGSNLCTRPAC